MKIVTTKLHRKGQRVTIANIEVSFDNECQAEVADADVEILTSKDESISIVDESMDDENKASENNLKIVGDEDSESDDDSEKQDEGNNDDSEKSKEGDEDDTLTLEGLKEMKVVELQDIAKSAELPSEEWNKMKKDELVSYLFEKLN